MPMAELRKLAADLGFEDVETYIQSGNLLGSKAATEDAVIETFEEGLLDRFGFEIDVIVRPAGVLPELAEGGVFEEAETERANLVHVVFARNAPTDDILNMLEDYRDESETTRISSNHLWIDYASGSARSKITHDVLRRAFDGPVTSRNFKTVKKLAGML